MTDPIDPTALTEPEVGSDGVRTSRWWQRHRRLTIAAIIAVIALVTVLTDLPVGTTRASDLAAERSVMTEVNADLAPCGLAVHQALGIWTLKEAHQLSQADRAPTPSLLSDDQAACSLTSEGIYDLSSNIEVPGTVAGKHLGQMVAAALLWTTSDAVRVVEDVQTLMDDPTNAATARDLAKAEDQLVADRRAAVAQEAAADRALATRLQPVELPTVTPPVPSSTS